MSNRYEVVTGEQPIPKPGLHHVSAYIKTEITHVEGSPEVLVFEDCLMKLQAGEIKYGSALMTNNGRDSDLDAYQDILDSINYQAQGFLEENLEPDLRYRASDINAALCIATNIRQRLVRKGVLSE